MVQKLASDNFKNVIECQVVKCCRLLRSVTIPRIRNAEVAGSILALGI